MKPRRGYVPEQAIYPLVGLNTLDPSTQSPQGFSPDLLNVVSDKGVITKRKGYSYLGGTLTDPVIGVVEFEDITGSKTLLAFTTKKEYKYDVGSNTWTNITYQSAGVDVNRTGTESNQLCIATISGRDGGGTYRKWIVITNGVDEPRYWDGAASKFALYAPSGITGFKTCKTISQFYDRVVLGSIVYSTGAYDKTMIAWSDTQDLLDFAGTGAGQVILLDTDAEIRALYKLGDRLYIYCDNTIHSMVYVGGSALFSFEKIVMDTRLLGQRSVANVSSFHLYMSQQQVILFDGSRLLREVGDRIFRAYRDELFATNRHYSFAHHDPARRQVYFVYPIAGDLHQIYVMEYELEDMLSSRWYRWQFTDRPTSMGLFSRSSDLTCDSAFLANILCSGTDMLCSQGSIKGTFPVKVFGTSGGRVCLADEILPNDQTVGFNSYFDTIDFTPPEGFRSTLGRWTEIELELQGVEADIYISVDQGQTYQYVKTLRLDSTWKKYKVFIDKVVPTMRVRIRNECPSSTFSVRWIRLWVNENGNASS